jgi:hypothetical protein
MEHRERLSKCHPFAQKRQRFDFSRFRELQRIRFCGFFAAVQTCSTRFFVREVSATFAARAFLNSGPGLKFAAESQPATALQPGKLSYELCFEGPPRC